MNISHCLLIISSSFIINILVGCSDQQPANIDEALALYCENRLEQALPLFEQLVAQDEKNPETYVWLAETYRRVGKKEEAVKAARLALELDPCNSFAHTVLAEASNPIVGEWELANSDTAWLHLMKAIECDSSDGNPWLTVWGEAIRRGETLLMHRALRRMVETGFLTEAALNYGRWMLRALPENAILITNGDMDTYPHCAVQEVEGFRKDVVIINRGTLNTTWYARFIRDYAGVTLPFDDAQLENLTAYKDHLGNLVTPSDQIFRKWVEQKSKSFFSCPIAVAATVDTSFLSGIQNNMRFAGAFLQWHDVTTAKTLDIASMHVSLKGLSPNNFTGPWVSDQDRSPIRRMHTKNIVQNVTLTAILYGELLLEANRIDDANRWAIWSEELDKTAELGPVFTKRIAQLKADIGKATH